MLASFAAGLPEIELGRPGEQIAGLPEIEIEIAPILGDRLPITQRLPEIELRLPMIGGIGRPGDQALAPCFAISLFHNKPEFLRPQRDQVSKRPERRLVASV